MAAQPLARIDTALRVVPNPAPPPPAPRQLAPREKAAVIVRLLLAEGMPLQLAGLPEHMQASLAQQMSQMRLIDRTTVAAVIRDFVEELEQVGLTFPGGIEGALALMDGQISQTAASRLRRLAGASSKVDPWDRINALPTERLMSVLEEESVEVAAVMLSKLPVPKAAELLGKLPGVRARRVAYAVSMTGNVDPETVRRIGASLATQLDAQPPKAFDTGPVERVGAILNVSGAQTREDVLKGLEEADRGFADLVRKAIFTFIHIPKRLLARDVPKVVRIVDQAALVTALAAGQGQPDLAPTVEHFLSNMSQRMAQGLREEMTARGKPREKDAEDAMTAVVSAIRQLESAGELVLEQDED
jgi:flagellar motor switch protein FliG